jgi:hypothetical protein
LDELEKTLANMRKSLGGQSSVAAPVHETFGTSFGHPLDMLARTAANTTSPDDRFSTPGGTAFNGITPPAAAHFQRPTQRVVPSDSINTTWSTELSGIDPVERGWLDIDDAKMLFER